MKSDGDRADRARVVLVLLVVALLLSVAYGLATGASDASAIAVLKDWLVRLSGGETPISDRDRLVIYSIRLPRVAMAVLVGAALAVSGAMMQGLFRNPLADPGVIGVSAGASLGAVAIIVLGGTVLSPVTTLLGIYALPLAAFLGGLTVTLTLHRVATRRGQTSIAMMLLAGIAIGALALALTGLLIFMADDRQLRDLSFWSLGSLAGATPTKLAAIAPIIIGVLLVAPLLARGLNMLALGEAAALHLGLRVQRFKHLAILAVAGATGAAVAVSGGIGFVGIVVPHLLRLVIGPDNRYLIPSSAVMGGALMVLADAISRTVVAPAELPIGIITAIVGGPFFLWILLRRRGVMDL